MKALFCTSWTDDYISSCLWDGLQEVLGHENVFDAGYTPTLHRNSGNQSPSWRVSGHRVGHCHDNAIKDYDLLVLNAALLRDHDWHWPITLRDAHCKPGCKVVFVEGGDGWNEISVPPFPVDAFFRREIAVGVEYPYPCRHLTFSAPMRWFDGTDCDAGRTYDVFSANAYHSHPVRWEMLPYIFRTQQKHNSIVGSCTVSDDRYLDYLRASKLALCAPGGASSDCMKFAEAPACGAIPIFVGVPYKVRENWYTPETAFFCGAVEEVPLVIDKALSMDLGPMRRACFEHARKYFSTRAMAEKVLGEVGLL